MTKPYSEMSAAERLADRIAKNREIDRHIKEKQAAASTPVEVGARRKDPRCEVDNRKLLLAEWLMICGLQNPRGKAHGRSTPVNGKAEIRAGIFSKSEKNLFFLDVGGVNGSGFTAASTINCHLPLIVDH